MLWHDFGQVPESFFHVLKAHIAAVTCAATVTHPDSRQPLRICLVSLGLSAFQPQQFYLPADISTTGQVKPCTV